MCVGLSARVVRVEEGTALIDASGAQREISAGVLDDLEPGDFVMVHAGVAIAKITEDDYIIILGHFILLRKYADVKPFKNLVAITGNVDHCPSPLSSIMIIICGDDIIGISVFTPPHQFLRTFKERIFTVKLCSGFIFQYTSDSVQ